MAEEKYIKKTAKFAKAGFMTTTDADGIAMYADNVFDANYNDGVGKFQHEINAELAASIGSTGEAGVISIEKDTTAAGLAARYTIKQGGVALPTTIDIAKDLVVKSGEVVTLAANEVEGKEAGTYIKLQLQNDDNTIIYINVGDLIEYVTSGSATTDAIQISVNATTHKVTASVKDGSITAAMLEEEYVTTGDFATFQTENSQAIANAQSGAEATAQGYVDTAKNEINKTIEDNEKVIAEALNEIRGLLGTNSVADEIDALRKELIGNDSDAMTASTIEGAKAWATDKATTAETNANSYTDTALTWIEVTA